MMDEKKKMLDLQIAKTDMVFGWKDTAALLGAVFCGTFGLITTFCMPFMGLSFLGITAGLGATLKGITKRRKLINSRLTQERKHLDKIESEGINSSREMNTKRVNKLNELKESKKEKEKSKKKAKLINNLSLIGLGASAALACLVPPIGLAATAICASAKCYGESKLTKRTEETEKLNNRINNLNNDLEAIREKLALEGEAQARQKVEEKQEPQTKVRIRKNPSRNEALADQYVDRLAEEPLEEAPIQKAKY